MTQERLDQMEDLEGELKRLTFGLAPLNEFLDALYDYGLSPCGDRLERWMSAPRSEWTEAILTFVQAERVFGLR